MHPSRMLQPSGGDRKSPKDAVQVPATERACWAVKTWSSTQTVARSSRKAESCAAVKNAGFLAAAQRAEVSVDTLAWREAAQLLWSHEVLRRGAEPMHPVRGDVKLMTKFVGLMDSQGSES